MVTQLKALIIEDEHSWQRELQDILHRENFEVDLASTSKEAFCQLENNFYDLVTIDIGLPEKESISWKGIIRHIRDRPPNTRAFIVTGYPKLETAIEAINYYPISGYFLKQPFDVELFHEKLTEIPAGLLPSPLMGSTEVDRIEYLCSRFHLVAKRLQSRHNGRNTLNIEDEYDVQDLLYGLLTLYYDDIRPEDPTPIFGGSSSRIDFVLSREGIVIEVKKTRKGLSDKEIGDQLAVDIAKYRKHPDCKTLVCFVYDPEEKIRNPDGLTADLESLSSDDFTVRIFIRPIRK